MRSVRFAAAMLALAAAGDAGAQHVGAAHPDGVRPGTTFDAPPPAPPPAAGRAPFRPQSWQRPAAARASAPAPADRASGDRGAYRRPYRGYALPPSWVGPRFDVTDWRLYGLTPPLPGYRWVRYFDDAVLVDARGSVFDTRFDVDWERGRARMADAPPVAAAVDARVAAAPERHAAEPYGDDMRFARAEDAPDRVAPPRRLRGRRYAIPVAPDYAPPPPPADDDAYPGPDWRSPDGMTTVTTTTTGPAYAYPGGTTTTVVVQSAPVVTTTTTEIYEDRVAYPRTPVVRTKVRRAWRPAPGAAYR